MENIMLTLKKGVMLTEQKGQVGLTLLGRTRFAKDPQQAQIIRALTVQSQPLKSLMMELYGGTGPPHDGNEICLAMAKFILDFSEYLEP